MLLAAFSPQYAPVTAGYHRLARVAKQVNAAPLKGATPLEFAGSSPAPGIPINRRVLRFASGRGGRDTARSHDI